jgi:germination protein M
MLPKGFSRLLPKGTAIKGLNLKDGVAIIDFSKEFTQYDPKTEESILNAVTWTLTGFQGVKEVNIWVEGKPLEAMPKGKTPAQHLTRNRGINLEVSEGVNLGQSVPVTLYFLGQTSTNETYYVPVTRMVNKADNMARATLDELVKGPALRSNLISALANNTQVNKVTLNDDTVMVDFGDQLLEYNNQSSISKARMESIVFSLTETTVAKNVKLTVNGKRSITVSGQKREKADQPVSRPEMVNPTGL